MTSSMELFVAVVNSFYQWTIVIKISVLDVETVPPEQTALNDKAFQLSISPFLKVDSKQHYFLMGSFDVKWAKSQESSHLTHMDFAEILSSQCTHQEMKILKILSSCEYLQNYSHLNYRLFSLDIKPFQFENALIQPVLTVNIWNFEW